MLGSISRTFAPDFLPTYFNLGLLYYRWRKYEQAVTSYLGGQSRGFDNSLLRYQLGLAYSAMSKNDDALKAWNSVLADDPDGPLAGEIRAQISLLRDRWVARQAIGRRSRYGADAASSTAPIIFW